MSRVRAMNDFKTSLRAMNRQCLGIVVNDTNMSELSVDIFIKTMIRKKKRLDSFLGYPD